MSFANSDLAALYERLAASLEEMARNSGESAAAAQQQLLALSCIITTLDVIAARLDGGGSSSEPAPCPAPTWGNNPDPAPRDS